MKEFKSPAIHRTPIYRAYAAYYGMQARCRNANGKNPAYTDVELRMTLDEWLDWSVPQYERFIGDHPNESPNVSRIGDAGHYEIGNVRIVSGLQNKREQKHTAPQLERYVCATCGTGFIRRKQGERKYQFCSKRCVGLKIGFGRPNRVTSSIGRARDS